MRVNTLNHEPQSTIAAKKLKGAFEALVNEQFSQAELEFGEQITLQTQSGIRTRPDFIARIRNGDVSVNDAKSSATARLTKNQRLAFPENETSGATVVGNGKPGFPGGTIIQPTKPKIIRPDDLQPPETVTR